MVSAKQGIFSCLFTFLIACIGNPTLKAHAYDDYNQADYVIVGVGTAGAVLAKELTDDMKTSVIALHVGENLTNNPLIKYTQNVIFTVTAALFGEIDINALPQPVQDLVNTLINMLPPLTAPLYETGHSTPQPNADNNELLWAMALPEGGASSINAGAWCWGTDEVYAQWEAIAGHRWSVKRIREVYKGLEDYHGKTTDPEARGFNGPIYIRQIPNPSGVSKKFTKAVIRATGFPFVLDYNDPKTPIGVSPQLQIAERGFNGKYRVSSATAFLNKKVMTQKGYGVNGRKLRVLFESQGLKVIWKGNKAIGVEYMHCGEIKKVYAKKGVIVSAGLRSSSFLMYSGVGPQTLLESLNIPVIYDNPNVGQGLADQPHLILQYTSNPVDTNPENGSVFCNISWLPAPGGNQTKREVRFTTVSVVPGLSLALLDLCQPKSRGSITINSSNPLDPPVIDMGALTDHRDLTLFRKALQQYVKPITQQIHEIDSNYKMFFPNPQIFNSDAETNAFIREEFGSNQHFQSHCRMAPLDEGGVVDSKGRVYGVENLIVADDSIVPLVMDGSPMASAYLIGANIARILKDEH